MSNEERAQVCRILVALIHSCSHALDIIDVEPTNYFDLYHLGGEIDYKGDEAAKAIAALQQE